MKCLFPDTRVLDEAAKARFLLTDDIMMENAARALQHEVYRALKKIIPKSAESSYVLGVPKPPHANFAARVLIVCGSGNNGGDGYALSRRITGALLDGIKIECGIYEAKPPKTDACRVQYERAKKAGVSFVDACVPCDVLVDCLFGSGFSGARPLLPDIHNLLRRMNDVDAYKIACDVPSALGSIDGSTFKADVTVTMGALKTCLYDDGAKDFCGKIVCAPLGISRKNYESCGKTETFLLEESDVHLPHRASLCTNKGNFGHVAVIAGEKLGAAIIAGKAAFSFGVGLVTLVTGTGMDTGGCAQSVCAVHGDGASQNTANDENSARLACSDCVGDFHPQSAVRYTIPSELMTSPVLPPKTSAVALGMGLGQKRCDAWADVLTANPDMPCVIDADMFSCAKIAPLLATRCAGKKKGGESAQDADFCAAATTVLTPHPKECATLFKLLGIAGFETVSLVQQNRIGAVKAFCERYPRAVFLLKGANPVIGYTVNGCVEYVINPFGMSSLSKAGSGDVLSGLVAALLSQGYSAREAAVSASLAHALASGLAACDYALTPSELILCVKKLGERKAANGSRTHLSTLGRSCNTDIR